MDMEEESNLRCKRSKFMAQSQQCVFFSLPGDPTPLGLTLRKTPSFLNLVETKLSHASTSEHEFRKEGICPGEQQTIGKTKASNFYCSLLRIGPWERTSRFEAELVGKCYYAKRKLVWEILDGELKNKIEIPWSDIASLRATFDDGATETLEIELSCRPTFFQETNPQPRKHTLWKATSDFSGGQASTYRRHFLQFPKGNLRKHYEKLLKSDKRLSLLNKRHYPAFESPFFGSEDAGDQNRGCHQFLKVKEQSLTLLNRSLEQSTIEKYMKHSECFTISKTSPILQQLSKLDFPVALSKTPCPSPVMDLSSVEAAFSRGGNLLGHDTSSLSFRDMFPTIFGSFLPSGSDFSMPVTAGHYPYAKKAQEDDTKKEISDKNIGLLGSEQPRSDSIVNCNGSTSNKDSLLQISEIQTDWNLLVPISSCNNSVNDNDIDGYFSCEFSVSEDSERISGKLSNHLMGISSSVPFPLFFVEDSAADEIREIKDNLEFRMSGVHPMQNHESRSIHQHPSI